MHASSEQQLAFIAYLQRIFTEGDFVATYKCALLHGIADIAIERSSETHDLTAARTITLDELATKFVELYWQHSLPYSATGETATLLKQSSGRQAIMLTELSRLREEGVRSVTALRRHDAWRPLLARVRRILVEGPLWRLQILGGREECHLYPHQRGADHICLNPGILYCLHRFYDLVVSLSRQHWLQLICDIKGNQPLIGPSVGLESFLFGSSRQALGRVGEVLRDLQGGTCFYCNKAIQGSGEVDHFIPWRRYPIDLGHNFVLAHANCNRSKRDFLAAPEHRDTWYEQNILTHGAYLSDELAPLVSVDAERSTAIATWAYQQALREHARLWRGIDLFVDVTAPSVGMSNPGFSRLF
ncbi:HNH endonuclease [Aeromonas veronii]|uniref:HNH endonuclease n=1 Tax=Aeromonas veronii TaxID=654 RepID=UPI001F27ED4C|nr:HNH endonuclease [Aeromonas veronii]MCF5839460.1 HNH endonuclease [Aeromonas veronii]